MFTDFSELISTNLKKVPNPTTKKHNKTLPLPNSFTCATENTAYTAIQSSPTDSLQAVKTWHVICAHHAAVSFKFFLPLSKNYDVFDSYEVIKIPCLELGGKLNFYHLVAENES